MVVSDSAASRNSSVEMALSAATGTLLKVRFMACRWVWVAPAGICATAAMVVLVLCAVWFVVWDVVLGRVVKEVDEGAGRG